MRSFISVLIKAGFIAVLLAALVPGQALAQNSCNASVGVATVPPDAELLMGEAIPIVVTLGAGQVLDVGQDGGLGWLDISQFEYKLDCNAGETFDTCTDAGNSVDFIETSLWTDCTDEQAPAQAVVLEMDENPDTDKHVIFSPSVPHVIRNNSDTTCQVGFDVVVDSVLPGNNDRVVQMTGWLNAGGDGNVGICSNGLVAAESADIALNFDVSVAARFLVTKDFTDDNTDPVDVHIRCDTGLPLYQTFTITESSHVTFVVTDFQPGELDCHIWEDPVPGNYSESYLAGVDTGTGLISEDGEGCYFNEVEGGAFSCEVTNTAGTATYTVNKAWFLGHSEEVDPELVAPVTIFCDLPILDGDVQGSNPWYVQRELIGLNASTTVTVDTSGGDALCEAVESPMSNVEVENGCRPPMTVSAGDQASCLINNTMFFEGIPTLSQYGLALLVLLTLGIGMVGFRRYA